MRSQTAATRSDQAFATVIGFVLILAVAITYYAYVAKNDVPRWGADAEHQWDSNVGSSLERLSRSSFATIGSSSSTSISVPQPPQAKSFDVPLIAKTQPVPPGGSVSFLPDCGGVNATHNLTTQVVAVWDLRGQLGTVADDAAGCLEFNAEPVYTSPFRYRTEFGGLLRVQGSSAIVLAGPPLHAEKQSATELDFALTLIGLRGPANSGSPAQSAVTVDLVPRSSGPETIEQGNAYNVTLTLQTDYPLAWKAWFDQTLGAELAANEFQTVIEPTPGDNNIPDLLWVRIFGPDASQAVNDVNYALTYGLYDVSLR